MSLRRRAVRTAAAFMLLAGGPALPAFAKTKFQSTWRAPDTAGVSFKGQKVLAMVITSHVASRNGAEVALANELTARGMQGVPAYSVIPASEIKDKDKVKARVLEAGFVGAVVLRAAEAQKEITTSPSVYWGGYYSSFSGYYGWGWGSLYDPGYTTTDTIFNMEILIYDVKADKLVWAGMSASKNPKTVDALVHEIASGVASQVKKSAGK